MKPSILLIVVWLAAGCRDATQSSASMAPTIKAGERVSIDYSAYSVTGPKRWDVIAFRPPQYEYTDQVWAKRVVGLPGDTVAFATGGITINGKQLAVPPQLTNVIYVSLDRMPSPSGASMIASPYVVPAASYFVVGDNSTNSNDSRFWGAVPRTNILGRVRSK